METLAETISHDQRGHPQGHRHPQEQVLAFNRDIAAAFARVELPSWVPTPRACRRRHQRR